MWFRKALILLAVLACAAALIIYFISRKNLGVTGETAGTKHSMPARRLFPVAHENKWGFIDTSGKVVIPMTYTFASEFNDGYAAVQVGDKWGYINEDGKMVIPPQFEEADRFVDGLARVVVDSKVSPFPGFIDASGKMAVRTDHAQYLGVFSDGLAMINTGGNFGYIDRTGKSVIAPQYDIAANFAHGMARVGVRSGDDYRWGYIDRTGKLVIPIQYDDAGDFSEGLASVRTGTLYGYIDAAGSLAIVPQFEYAGDFKEGLAPVLQIKFGYIDRTGKMVIPPQFDMAYSFSEGLARVVVTQGPRQLMGFIDKKGHFVIEAHYDDAGDFRNGFAMVSIGDYSGFIDPHGTYLWQPCASCNPPVAGPPPP